MSMTEKHVFAFFTQNCLPNATSSLPGSNFTLSDEGVWWRIFNVLRLESEDVCIIFDGQTVIQVKLMVEKHSKKGVVRGHVVHSWTASALQPSIYFYQGLLRREAFDEVVYTAAQMGVTELIPLLSAKVQRHWAGEREVTRLEKVMIAACEQSKQFVIPPVSAPRNLEDLPAFIAQSKDIWIYLDPRGKPFVDLVNLATLSKQAFHVIIGPEGGFTSDEQKILQDAGVQGFALTPTILRSTEAAVLALGTLRSVLSTNS